MSGPAEVSRAPQITRRRMLAGSGVAVAAPLVLTACGSSTEADERSAANDPDLLNQVLAQHLAVLKVLKSFRELDSISGTTDVTKEYMSLREDSVAQLQSFIEKQGGTPADEPAAIAKAESRVEVLTLQLGDSIEASLSAIGDISEPSFRQAIHRAITEDAALLALYRSVTGGEIAPDSFVFGPPTTQAGES